MWMRYAIAVLAQLPFFVILKAIDTHITLGNLPIIYALMLIAIVYLLGEGPAVPVFIIDTVIFFYFFLPPGGEMAVSESNVHAVWAYALGAGVVAIATAAITRSKRKAEELARTLKKREDDLSQAQAVTQTGSWRLNIRRDELQWSDETYKMFGVPKGTPLTAEMFFAIVHPDDREYVKDNWQASMRGDYCNIEHRIVVDNKIKWVCETAVPEFDDDGELVGGFGTVQDISARRQQEQALARTRQEAEQKAAQLESFFASMADGVILLDSNGRIIMINDAGRKMIDMYPGEEFGNLTKRAHWLTLEGDPFPVEQTASRRALAGEVITDARYRICPSTGQDIAISVSASPVRDSKGRVIGAASVFRDISERAKFEQQRQQLFEREHRIAETLQQALIPSEIPSAMGNWSVAAKYQPALEEAKVGGDFYDVFPLRGGKYGILIGDIAGKGLAAAIRVASVRHTIRSYAYMDPSPARVMMLTNNSLCKEGADENEMLSAFYAIVDPGDNTIVYANAGHEPPVVRNINGCVGELEVTGPMLGIINGFQYLEKSFTLEPASYIVMFTDGITEARKESDLFGKDGVIEHLSEIRGATPEEVAETLLQAATDYAGGCLQDDAAILVLDYEE